MTVKITTYCAGTSFGISVGKIDTSGVSVGTGSGVSVGGTGVFVGGSVGTGVSVGGTGVFVGGSVGV